MTSQILKIVDFTKTQKSRYLDKETFFLPSNKKNSLIKGYFMAKNSFVVEVTFKSRVMCALSLLEHFNHMNSTCAE